MLEIVSIGMAETDSDQLEDVIYQTFVENGDTMHGSWCFDNPAAAKACVDEYVSERYGFELGEWNRDPVTGNHYLDVGPDGFNVGVFVHEVHSSRDTALEGFRESIEEESEVDA